VNGSRRAGDPVAAPASEIDDQRVSQQAVGQVENDFHAGFAGIGGLVLGGQSTHGAVAYGANGLLILLHAADGFD